MMKHKEIDSRNIVILNKGTFFVGNNAPLKYISFKIEEIENVSYTFARHYF